MRLTRETPFGNYDKIHNYDEPGRDEQECIYKLGQYEDIDTDPEHLAKIKKAFEIIKNKRVDIELWRFTSWLDSYNRLVCEDRQLTEEEHELFKEIML